jgi:hypothetical protein
MIKKWFMTPTVGIRHISEDKMPNRAKIMAMTGGGTGGQDGNEKYKMGNNQKAILEKIDSSRHEGSQSNNNRHSATLPVQSARICIEIRDEDLVAEFSDNETDNNSTFVNASSTLAQKAK